MFRKYGVTVVCGNGIGKTNAAIGKGIKALADGKTVTLIQFLKGKANSDLMQVLKKLEPEMKAFSFEKYEGLFENLPEEEKKEEILNIRNGLSFARKVMVTGGADVLILDEVLGLVDRGILPQDELRQLLAVRPEEMQLIITGKVFPEELKDCVDLVSRIETIYRKN